ncbi:peptide-methionine (R)-S-oxide reductase MsrB [Flavicella marina]|uniref:peptide-methionine (R)-S-oxide reductase MsrB n=1 Tax=Flavicella marina TaxID=1475951 RepID=UPI0012657B0A|nr:peptide-methionine (R)-S-oxide reductase MsrB [Flavicella marina]
MHLNKIIALFVLIVSTSFGYSQEKVVKTESEWKQILSDSEYYVLREKGTEQAGSGVYNKHYEKGVYNCAGCNTPLFRSENKYNSYSGWPSFDRFIKSNVEEIEDTSYGMKRTEVVCAICDGHLGHVFNDGPKETTGLRYCINSVSLKFKPTK